MTQNLEVPMKRLIAVSSVCLAAISASALPDYDVFADATGSGGTAYTAGQNLIGQNNGAGRSWVDAQTGVSTGHPLIASGSLSVSGLLPSSGNMVQLGGTGKAARFGFTSVGSPITSGTVYYSFAMRLADLTGINTSAGSFWAGFNNSLGTQAGAPTVVATRVITKAAVGGFNIGTAKNSATTSDWVFHTSTFTTSDTLFIVGSYTINSVSTTDDVSQMWVNPNSSFFGALSAPTADMIATGGNDITANQLASFVVFNRAGTPGVTYLDELRIGTSWADVTPVPEPAVLAVGGFGLVALLLRRIVRK